MMDSKEIIAARAALEIGDGDVVNLGIGTPELVTRFLPEGIVPFLQSENGMLGMGNLIFSKIHGTGERLTDDPVDYNYVNAGGKYVTAVPGASFFASDTSFMLIRGGHVAVSILGALEVDANGNLANHIIPGKRVPGMGGAMDLVNGSRKVIITMTHTNKNGSPKIVQNLTLPTTAVGCVDMIITELAVFTIDSENGLVLTEHADGVSVDEIREKTGAAFTVSPDLKPMATAL